MGVIAFSTLEALVDVLARLAVSLFRALERLTQPGEYFTA